MAGIDYPERSHLANYDREVAAERAAQTDYRPGANLGRAGPTRVIGMTLTDRVENLHQVAARLEHLIPTLEGRVAGSVSSEATGAGQSVSNSPPHLHLSLEFLNERLVNSANRLEELLERV